MLDGAEKSGTVLRVNTPGKHFPGHEFDRLEAEHGARAVGADDSAVAEILVPGAEVAGLEGDAQALFIFVLELAFLLFAQSFLGAFVAGDVANGQAANRRAILDGLDHVEACDHEPFALGLQAKFAGLGQGRGERFAHAKVEGVLIVFVNALGEMRGGEPRALDVEHIYRGHVCGANDAGFGQSQIANRGEVVEFNISFAGLFELKLSGAQLLVLHLQLNLVDVQLVQSGLELVRGHASDQSLGRAPAQPFLGLVAQGRLRQRLMMGTGHRV